MPIHLITYIFNRGGDASKINLLKKALRVATFAAECGFSDAQIRLMGRWQSDAFRKYICSPSFAAHA